MQLYMGGHSIKSLKNLCVPVQHFAGWVATPFISEKQRRILSFIYESVVRIFRTFAICTILNDGIPRNTPVL